jgi:hypothetical protein
MEWICPKSVIDLGCGMGDWLSVFKEAGVEEILGIDGDHVPSEQLAIQQHEFVPHDLTNRFAPARQCDLAMSLEVAEHLPIESARPLIHSLTDLASVVLFSAAIPNQPGQHHVNCQWPAYWATLFRNRGYVAIDAIRLRLWNDSRVNWWYRQNIIVYASEKRLDQWPKLQALWHPDGVAPLPLVHPEMFVEMYRNLVEWGADWEKKYWWLWGEFQHHTMGK